MTIVAGRRVPTASQLGRQAGHFAKHVVPAAVKPIHSLWHEVLGFVFLALAGIWLASIVRQWHTHSVVHLLLVTPLVLLLIGYGVSSLLKARRISRS